MRSWAAVNLRGSKSNTIEGLNSTTWRMETNASLIIRLWSKAKVLTSFNATQQAW